jgi:hypothetical protein
LAAGPNKWCKTVVADGTTNDFINSSLWAVLLRVATAVVDVDSAVVGFLYSVRALRWCGGHFYSCLFCRAALTPYGVFTGLLLV